MALAATFAERVERLPAMLGVVLALSASTGVASAQTLFVYDDAFLEHDPGATHPERAARLQAIMAHLKAQGVLDSVIRPDALEPAPERWLTTVHLPDYLDSLERAARDAPTELDADTVVSKASYRAARLAAGGTLVAVDAIMRGDAVNAFIASRPPGHHALPERAMGFCLINHVAVAARYAQQAHGIERVLIVDWDVHHGNATQAIFYDDPSVLYFSTHQYPYYPGSGSRAETGSGAGEGYTVNVPLAAGDGDEAIIAAFERELRPAAESFAPQFVFISAGFDAHRDDPLANLEVTERGFAKLTEIVADIARQHANGRIVSVLEGGYALDALARSVAAHVATLNVHAVHGE